MTNLKDGHDKQILKNDIISSQSTPQHILDTRITTGTSRMIESPTMSPQDKQALRVGTIAQKILEKLTISRQNNNDQQPTLKDTPAKKQKIHPRDPLKRKYPLLSEEQISRIEKIDNKIDENRTKKVIPTLTTTILQKME